MPYNKNYILRYILPKIACLHLYVNGASCEDLGVKDADRKWTLPVSGIKSLLEFIGSSMFARTAIIDGNEPALDSKELSHLMAWLQVYGWSPILNTTGEFMKNCINPSVVIKRLMQIGPFKMKINLDARRIKDVGLKNISMLYREAKRNDLRIVVCYQLDKGGNSRVWLQRFLSCPDFNNVHSEVYITPIIYRDPRDTLRAACSGEEKSLFELIVGHKGTLLCNSFGLKNMPKCSLSDKNWKEVFSNYLLSLKRRAYVQV
jgi:hypothetical protein